MSTLIGYFIPNPVFMICKKIVCRYQFLKEPEPICFHTAKWFQVLLYNNNNFIQHYLFAQLNDFKYRKLLDISIWPVDSNINTLIVLPLPFIIRTTTLGQIRPGSNGSEEVLHIPQNSRTGAPTSDGLVSYPGHLLKGSYSSAEMQSVYSTAPADWPWYFFIYVSFGIKSDNTES